MIIAILVLLVIILLYLGAIYNAVDEIRNLTRYTQKRSHQTWEMVMHLSVSWKRRQDATLPLSSDYWNYNDPTGNGYFIIDPRNRASLDED